jgi:hypothetical protein
MKITYGTAAIGTEPDFLGLDTLAGFTVDGEQLFQWMQRLRAADDVPIPRGNRRRTIEGSVMLATQPSLQAASVLRSSYYDGLAVQGDLVVTVGTQVMTWAASMLKSCTGIKGTGKNEGVTVGFQFVFYPAAPCVTTTAG